MNLCLWKLPNLLWIDTSGIKADTNVVVIVPDAYKHCILYYSFFSSENLQVDTVFGSKDVCLWKVSW